jgi:alpha-L-rhamnosidase
MLLGDLLIWLFEDLAGIKSDTKETGFKKIIMEPEFNAGPSEVNAYYFHIQGTIISRWTKKGNDITWNIIIPPNAHAIISIPGNTSSDIKEGYKPVANAEGVRFLKTEPGRGRVLFEIGSGRYVFSSNVEILNPERSDKKP